MSTRNIDLVILNVQQELPDISVWQLQKRHPGDDDGLWFFSLPGLEKDIQIESSTGNCPFLVETEEQSSYEARTALTVNEVTRMIVEYFKFS